MFVVHKIQLKPDKQQEEFFFKSAGVARFAYNWALSEWGKQYKAGGSPTEYSLGKQLNAIKREQFPWMLEVSKNAPQQAVKDVGKAFKTFFRSIKAGKKSKYPKFKKKGRCKDEFRPDNGSTKSKNALNIQGKEVHIPKLGWVQMAEPLRFNGKIISSTISRDSDKRFNIYIN